MLVGKVVGSFVGIPVGIFVGMPEGIFGIPPPPDMPVGMLVGMLVGMPPPPDRLVGNPVGRLIPPFDEVGVGVGFGISWGCGEQAVIITAAPASAVAPRAN